MLGSLVDIISVFVGQFSSYLTIFGFVASFAQFLLDLCPRRSGERSSRVRQKRLPTAVCSVDTCLLRRDIRFGLKQGK